MLCPICNNEVNNRSIPRHARARHGIDNRSLFLLLNNLKNEPTCAYQKCQTIPKFWGALKGYSKYCDDHRAAAATERNSWNVGLTKETDLRIAKNAVAISISKKNTRSVSWTAGKTKESDARLLEISKKQSQAMLSGSGWWDSSKRDEVRKKLSDARLLFLNPGLTLDQIREKKRAEEESKNEKTAVQKTSWSKGLTKETDIRIKKISDSIISRGGSWNKGLTRATSKTIAHVGDSFKLADGEIIARCKSFSDKFKLLSPLSQYTHVQGLLSFECSRCGLQQQKSIHSIEHGCGCSSCDAQRSRAQIEIFDYVRELGFMPISNARKAIAPFELDIFVPEKKFAVEFNGLYWHSDAAGHEPRAHDRKTELCADVGVSLMHVFEDEWASSDKRHIVKSMISSRLGLASKLDARKLTFSEIPNNVARNFFEANHLDGSVPAISSFGLVSSPGDELVACVSLRKPFAGKHEPGSVEIARFATKLNHTIRGGFSKIFKNILKTTLYTKFVTYADLRYGTGNVYEQAGFKHVSKSPPRFWWTDYKKRINRLSFRATEGVSQIDMAKRSGFVKIYGCSNKKFTYDVNGG